MGTSIFSPQSGTISVEYEDGSSELLPNQFVLIATGSRPQTLPFLKLIIEIFYRAMIYYKLIHFQTVLLLLGRRDWP